MYYVLYTKLAIKVNGHVKIDSPIVDDQVV